MGPISDSVVTQSGVFLVMTVVGTVAFAVSGVLAAAEAGHDWLGATVVAIATAIGGGTVRDLLIGNIPVAWINDEWPVVIALGTVTVCLVALRVRPRVDPRRHSVYLATDAVGLGAFVVVGTSISLGTGTSYFVAVLMGVVSGVGGGVARDLLTGRTPMIFVGQIYAVAGLCGALVYVGLVETGASDIWCVWVGTATVVAIRAVAIRFDLHLPRAGGDRPDF